MPTYARVWDHDTRGVLHGLPALLEMFALRALIVARGNRRDEPREMVLLPPGIDATQEVKLLNELGFGPRPEDVLPADAARLNGAIKGCDLYPFSGTSRYARQFAEATGARFRGQADLKRAWQFNDKGYFAELARGCYWHGVFVPRTIVVERAELSPSHIVECRERFGTQKLVIKGTVSASGLEQLVVHEGEEWDDLDFDKLGNASIVVIQGWVEHTKEASVQFSVNANGNARILSDTTQLIEGEVHHAGNVCPAQVDPHTRQRIRSITATIVRQYMVAGLRDTVGSVDFIIEGGGAPWACEVNARVVAPWYPWKAMQRRIPPTKLVPPFAMQSMRLPLGTTADQIASKLGNRLYNPGIMAGTVPFCIVPSVPEDAGEPKTGFTYLVTFGRTEGERDTLFAESIAALSS